ncbi:MAG: hypothetical protein N3H31_03155 [Candidatus Nezhaarchaeota archaeon]|nr:hypothetical protein [Candidatus Nezhaarchaeota archaeon]
MLDSSKPASYRTRVPARVRLDDGRVVEVSGEELRRGAFMLFAPLHVEHLRRRLLLSGFTDAPSMPRGERYSMVKPLHEPWELHVRLYEGRGGSFIEGEVEVGRRYVEHLSVGGSLPVVYEVVLAISQPYGDLYLLHKPSGRWVAEVLDSREVVLHPPRSLTEWRSLALAALGLLIAGLAAYALGKLKHWPTR